MSDISLQLTIKEESSHLFKRCIRKLLDATFILRDRDEKLFSFISWESNRQDISEYLRMIGFDILVDEKTGVGMLIASEEDSETVGLKRANVVTFTTLQYHLLLVLWKVYLMLDFMKKQKMQVIFCSPDKTESIGNECEVILPVLRVRADSMLLGIVQFHKEKANESV